jgi:hypothetical protein
VIVGVGSCSDRSRDNTLACHVHCSSADIVVNMFGEAVVRSVWSWDHRRGRDESHEAVLLMTPVSLSAAPITTRRPHTRDMHESLAITL